MTGPCNDQPTEIGDCYAERVAMICEGSSIPLVWAEALARLCVAPKPGAYEQETWDRLIDDAARLIERWHSQLTANAWQPADIRGLLPVIRGRSVIAIGRGDVTLEGADGKAERIVRRPAVNGAATWAADRRAA